MSTSEPRPSTIDRILRETLERLRAEERAPIEQLLQHPEVVQDLSLALTEAIGHRRRVTTAADLPGAKTEPASDHVAAPSDNMPPTASGAGSAGELKPPPVEKPPLRHLGDFTLLREVGRGGMGVVYEAEQVSLGRHVALKLLPEHLTRDPQFRRRFEREARAAGRLHHTNIVPVFGVGEHEGQPFYVMQFIRGLGLDKVLTELKRVRAMATPTTPPKTVAANPDPEAADLAWSLASGRFDATVGIDQEPNCDLRPVPTQAAASDAKTLVFSASISPGSAVDALGLSSPSQKLVEDGSVVSATRKRARHDRATYFRGVARLGVQVASALDHAHRQGIYHRDIKPSNLLLDNQGRVWMTDFGLAKADDLENLTNTGDILGTLRYIPPEALEGKFDARSDIYSLGLTLYELVALRPAFMERDKAQLLRQVASKPIDRLSQLVHEVPRDLETIIHKTIERDAIHRYTDAAALADDLQRFLDDEPIKARPLSTIEKFSRWRRRNPLVAMLLATVLALMAVVAIGFAIAFVRESQLREREQTALLELDRRLADNYTFSGLVSGDQGRAAQAVFWFAHAAQQARFDPNRLRANELRYDRWSREVPQPTYARLLDTDAGPERLTFDPRGRYLKITYAHERSEIIDLEAKRSLALPDAVGRSSLSTWNAAGDLIAGVQENVVELYRFPSLEHVASYQCPRSVNALSFTPDGGHLAVAVGSTVRLWSGQGPVPEFDLPEHPGEVIRLAFSPTGAHLVTRSFGHDPGTHEVRIFQFDLVRRTTRLVAGPIESPRSLDRRDGGPIFVDNDRSFILQEGLVRWSWRDVATGEIFENEETRSQINRIVGSPDGRTFTICRNPEAEVWDVASRKLLEPTLRSRNYVTDAAYRPDGRAILTVDGDKVGRIWSIPGCQPLTPLLPHQNEINHAAFAHDGKRFATLQKDGLLRVWESITLGTDWGFLPLQMKEGFAVLSDDGKFVTAAGWNYRRDQRSLQVYDVANASPVGPAFQAPGLINGAAFAPNGRDVLVLCGTAEFTEQRERSQMHLWQQPGQVFFWDSRSGQQLAPAIPTPSEPMGAAFSPDGTLAAVVCAGGQVMLVDPAKGRVVSTENTGHHILLGNLHRHWVRYMPKSDAFVTWGLGNTVSVWNGETGKRLRTMKVTDNEHVLNAFFSADGSTLFAAASDDRLWIWNVATGRTLREPLPHAGWAFNARLSEDGATIVSACRDRSARLWDWRRGVLRIPGMQHDHEVLDVEMTRDGRWIFTACKDGTVQAWDAKSGQAIGPRIDVKRFLDPANQDDNPSGYYPEQLLLTPDSRTLIVGGVVGRIALIPLNLFENAAPHELDAMSRWSELLSGQVLHEGGGVVNLTTIEWMRRWDAYQARRPSPISRQKARR